MYEYVTRKQWGANYKTDKSVAITGRTELLVHHTVVGKLDHSKCDDMVRQYEKQHHNQWGYSIGYNELCCQHLVWYEGCGRDVRGQHCPNHNTSALGLAYIGDGREELPDGLVAALRWRWDLHSNTAGRRLWLYPHKRFRATQCPGDKLEDEVVRGLIVPVQPTVPVPSPLPPAGADMTVQNNPVLAKGSTGHYVRILQGLLIAHAEDVVAYVAGGFDKLSDFVDGDFGQKTVDALTEWQKRTQYLVPDGVCGPATWHHLCGEQA